MTNIMFHQNIYQNWHFFYVDRGFFSSTAGRMSYLRREGKQAILLIHGFTASAEIWKNLIDYLDDCFDIISVDLFGHGNSGSKILDSIDFDLKKLIGIQSHSILELLNFLGIKNYSVVGSSFGGLIAMSLSLSSFKPDKVVLIDSAGTTPKDDEKFVNGLRALITDTSKTESVFSFPLAKISEMISREEIQIDSSIIKEIDIPVSVIWGSDDYIFDLKYGIELSNILPRSEFHTIENANHTPFTTQPQTVARIINEFVIESNHF